MKAHPMTINDVLAGQKQYVIPVFQRTYEWQKERWDALWQDLSAVSEETDRDLTHFIGPMVVISQAYPHEVPRYLVIDGQQRLMTLSVLFAALRDRAKNLKLDNIANAIESHVLFFLNTKGENITKIIPRIKDRNALANILEKKLSEADSNLLLTQAYKFFYKEIRNISPEHPTSFDESAETVLDRLYNAIVQRLKIVMITLDKEDDPSNIYESLNFKHETLTDASLIRNYVFMKLPSLEDQEQFDTTYWKDFEDLFNFDDDPKKNRLTDFYYRYLISKTEYMARKRLYTSFTRYIDDYLKVNDLIKLVGELSRYAKYFKAISYECEDEDLETAFARFRMLDAATAIPLLLSLYDRYSLPPDCEKHITKVTFLRMLRMVESFILRRSILRERTRGYGLDFALARDHSTTTDNLALYFITKSWPTDEILRDALKSFEFYLREPKKCRLVLGEIEKSFGHKEKVATNSKNIEIEHIMPQNLTQSWREMLGDKAEEEHGKFLHTLGNLTLTGYNGELGDKPFEEKKQEFINSKLSLNLYLQNLDKWTEKEILIRTDLLYDRLIDLWDRPSK